MSTVLVLSDTGQVHDLSRRGGKTLGEDTQKYLIFPFTLCSHCLPCPKDTHSQANHHCAPALHTGAVFLLENAENTKTTDMIGTAHSLGSLSSSSCPCPCVGPEDPLCFRCSVTWKLQEEAGLPSRDARVALSPSTKTGDSISKGLAAFEVTSG